MRLARRTLLKAGSTLIALAALGRTAYALPAPEGPEAALLRLISSRPAAERLGRRYLRQHPEEADAGRLARRILARLEAQGGSTARLGRASLRHTLAADFAAGRTRTIDGWILAETEADLCALAALKARGGRSASLLA